MLMLLIIFSSVLLIFKSTNCHFANIDITPNTIILNSTSHSTAKFICIKDVNDNLDFAISLSPNIPSNYIQTFMNRLNDTTVEITLHSYNYIGAFFLICSSSGKQTFGTRSDIFIGKAPQRLAYRKPCIVYYNKYIECTLYAPILVQAMNNRLAPNLTFIEHPLPFQPKVYRNPPEFVRINEINETVTYRFFPTKIGQFPSNVKMNVSGTIYRFGTTSVRIDMTPVFIISSNFTVDIVSSTDLRIKFNHRDSLTYCRGNLSRDDLIEKSNEKENFRTFHESNQTVIHITDLRPNTPYKICTYCHRESSIPTISDVQCHVYRTSKNWFMTIIIGAAITICCLIIFIVIFLIHRRNRFSSEQQERRQATDINENDSLVTSGTLTGNSELIPSQIIYPSC